MTGGAAAPLRVALVGCGAMGRLHARALRADPSRFALVGGYDSDASATTSLGLFPFATLAEAIDAAEVVVVATPIDAHGEPVLRALERGRDVFVEKPSGATFREAAALCEAARRADKQLFVGHSERFNPVVRAIATRLHGASPREITARRTARLERRRSQADHVLLSLGVHDVDLVGHLAGPRDSRVQIHVSWADGSHESAEVGLRAPRCEARLSVARTAAPRERRLVVVTEHERLDGDLLAPRLEATDLRTGTTRSIALGHDEPVVLQMRALHGALRGETDDDREIGRALATGMDGAHAVLSVETAIALAAAANRVDRREASSAENL